MTASISSNVVCVLSQLRHGLHAGFCPNGEVIVNPSSKKTLLYMFMSFNLLYCLHTINTKCEPEWNAIKL